MKKNSGKIIVGILLVFLISALVLGGVSLCRDGFLYVGDVWQNTPELALAIAADSPLPGIKERYTVVRVLETWQTDDTLYMVYISGGDTLVHVTLVTNRKGQYCVHNSTEEGPLDSPSEFVLNGDPEQYILFPYTCNGTMVCGWCYTEASFTVNGRVPSRRTHIVECQGQIWSLDFWWLEDVPEDDEITLSYTADR